MISGKDGKEINDGDIVECKYDEDAINGMIWVPIKLRDDKIKA